MRERERERKQTDSDKSTSKRRAKERHPARDKCRPARPNGRFGAKAENWKPTHPYYTFETRPPSAMACKRCHWHSDVDMYHKISVYSSEVLQGSSIKNSVYSAEVLQVRGSGTWESLPGPPRSHCGPPLTGLLAGARVQSSVERVGADCSDERQVQGNILLGPRTWTRTLASTPTYTQTRTHTRTHINAYTHACTRTHTHTIKTDLNREWRGVGPNFCPPPQPLINFREHSQ